MKRLILSNLLFLFLLPALPQSETVIRDGFTGISYWIWNDTIITWRVTKGSPAQKAGVRKNDRILEINGSPVSGTGISRMKFQNLLFDTHGTNIDLVIHRKSVDTLLDIDFDREFSLAFQTSCSFDYIVDPSGQWTLQDILSDSINSLFSSPIVKKTQIHSVPEGSEAEKKGLRAGDQIVSFEKDWRFSSYYYDFSLSWFLTWDTVLNVLRDSDTFEVMVGEDYRWISEIESQFFHDLKQHCIWMRLSLLNRLSEDRLFLLEFPPYDSITLYEAGEGNSYREQTFGNLVEDPHKEFTIKDHNTGLIELRKAQRQVFYIRLISTNNQYVEIYAICSSLDNTLNRDWMQRLVFGMVWGMMLIIAFYYLILFIYMRNRSYIFYSLFIISLVIVLIIDSGYSNAFINRKTLEDYNLLNILYYLPSVFFLLFGVAYLEIKNTLRIWYRILSLALWIVWIFIGVYGILNVGLLLGMDRFNGYLLDTIAGIYIDAVIPCILIVPAILKIRQKYKPAWYFLLGNIVLIGTLAYYASNYGGVSTDDFDYVSIYRSDFAIAILGVSLQLGVIFQILLFAIGLAQKMRDTERDKQRAQEETIKQLKENEKLKDKVNRELEAKVKERTEEILQQKEEIETQRDILFAQKNEITDSINYAQRIQTAALPDKEFMDAVMPEYFVLFKPRDIVSGDFYWIKEVKNYLIVVVADCTGHGVPGAFMSMLGLTLLNEQIGRSRLDKPGEILDRLRKKVKETLAQKGKTQEQKDGMDMALAMIDKENQELDFAGAFNPLYLIRQSAEGDDPLAQYASLKNEGYQLYDLKGDRQPIGVYSSESNFTTRQIQLQKGDTIYLFSDGFADQIGGPKGKKFMSRKFKMALLGIQHLSMEEQRKSLNNTLEKWSGNNEQVDDILVMGIRV
jgi:serine phosphatase RsbU (regulator of sigma subunit)